MFVNVRQEKEKKKVEKTCLYERVNGACCIKHVGCSDRVAKCYISIRTNPFKFVIVIHHEVFIQT